MLSLKGKILDEKGERTSIPIQEVKKSVKMMNI